MSFCVLTAEFAHETNTFSVRQTDYAAFATEGVLFGDEALKVRGTANTEIAGFLDAARQHSWNLQHIVSAAAEPAGPVTMNAFERIGGAIIKATREQKDHLDGILLALHGAMVTEFSPDGEGELLSQLRDVVGPHLPIAITLDPHANVTTAMCDYANIIVSFKTYPHIDMRDTAYHAAQLLQRTMSGEINPKTLMVRLPMLEEVNGGRTDIGPMTNWIEEARDYENCNEALAVSINGGFPYSDINEIGPSVLITYNGDPTPHYKFASNLAKKIWSERYNVLNQFFTECEAAHIAKEFKGDAPLIIADFSDNPGAGGYGDATSLLHALLMQNVDNVCFGPIVDPETVKQLQSTDIGQVVDLTLGGKTDPRFGGEPLRTKAKLLHLSNGKVLCDGPLLGGLEFNFGPTAVVQINGIDVLIVSIPSQMLDLQQFRTFGIDPAQYRVVALKSMQHFRAAFEPIASKVIVCDSGALCTTDYNRIPYKNIPRPIFPLDQETSLEINTLLY